ncbi:hypothetical protein LDZ77_07350 [Bacteroides xylanisolvens]|uniref:Uncharacterized protein n=1 Tax=Bacteroides xylanisolvens TaxID=371601 RepID=A0AAW4SX67_9BACE|nr:hypothetical protein [Bacteroides xylanisolvens]MCA4532228.1 hypothetical protein [Bacteroides xylanisolvens]MCA4550408.1 hypothetical protein [Bacteroides xylanisolvens]MCA4563564.1 hypothetical protein [Bacteroides xylanisolvens]MCA4568464.1 hypothetical protein [Bacteroides xylanisolvens]MCA4599206.1 hypothetical protein [Bacteroides xylanisolvens]
MKKYLLLLVTLCVFAIQVKAQYVRVNYDKKTIAAMVGAYGAETAAEVYYNEQVKNILDKYSAAEVAAAGIFLSKYMDRKGMTELGILASSTENYYYRRIYNLVSAQIMPKIWTVAGMMLRSPQTALYWGSYLMKICGETKSLCMQFESVVTNSELSFKDIAFLELDPRIAALFKLSESGDIDWQTMFDDFGNISSNFTKENLQDDIDKLYNMGVDLATTGGDNLSEKILGSSSFNDLLQGKTKMVINAVKGSYQLYEQMDKSIGNTLLSLVGGQDNVSSLFNMSNYNLSLWVTDYLHEAVGQYYTQRWYIYRRDAGSETLCDYNPPTDDNSVINGGEWVRFETGDAGFYPNAAQVEQILSNSERHAGWSRAKVNQLNSGNDGYTYSINYWRNGYVISRNGKQTKKAYAYSISVTKSWNHTEVIYEDLFDSYTMDLNAFKAQLTARLSEYNDNEEGYTYYIGSDAKKYYQATDAAKLKGCESVIISVTCHDGATLIFGTTSYKCRTCGGSLNAHTKECVMQTTLSGNESLDLSELDEKEKEYQQQISLLQSQIDQLENENADLIKKIASASVEDAAKYRLQYNQNKSRITQLQTELGDWQKKMEELADARAEANEDNAVPTDDYYRIPAILQDCKTAYSLTWQGDGWWEGYSYLRKATAPNIKGTVTFKATVSIARKPKYFLGIKIHRAIIQISWELTAEYTDTEVVDVLQLDPQKSDADRAKEVNNRISEIARQYPNCQVSTEYMKSAPAEEDQSEDAYHLLWSSDRLQVARQVDSRLTKIYADLVSLEKMMHYKQSIIDVLKDVAPVIRDDQGRRLTLVEQCRKRWLRGAANSLHSVDYNGKYEEE